MPINLKEMADNADELYKSLVISIKNSNMDIPSTVAAQRFQKDFHKLSLSNEIENRILKDSCKIVLPDN